MADKEFIFKQAKRIHDDCIESQENETIQHDADGLAEAYNDLLLKAQNEFSENGVISSLDEVHPEGKHGMDMGKGKYVQKVKSRTSRLADALEIDLADLDDADSRGELQPITVTVDQAIDQDMDQSQQQDQQQAQEQYVDVDTIIEDIDRVPMPPDEKEELKEIVREFEQELEDDRNPSNLRRLLDRAEEYSVDVVAKLGILGLQYGVTDLIVN